MPYIDYRWLGGMLTNYKTIRQSIKRLAKMSEQLEDKEFVSKMTKKEAISLMRAKGKLSRSVFGIKDMGGIPDMLFVIDVGMDAIAVQEANRLRIPVVGVVDTNSSLKGIDYVIPGNDDSIKSIELYCSKVADVILEAKSSFALEKKTNEPSSERADKTKAAVAEPKKKIVRKKLKSTDEKKQTQPQTQTQTVAAAKDV